MKKNILFILFFFKIFFIIEFFCTTQFIQQPFSDTASNASGSTANSDISTTKTNKKKSNPFDERLNILRKQYEQNKIIQQSNEKKNYDDDDNESFKSFTSQQSKNFFKKEPVVKDYNDDNESFKSFKSANSFKTSSEKIKSINTGTLSNAIKRFEEKQKQLSKSHIIKNNNLIQEGERLIKSQIEGKKIENILTPKELMKLRSISHKPHLFKKIDFDIKNKLKQEQNAIREKILQQKFDKLVKQYIDIIENDSLKKNLEDVINKTRKLLLHAKIEQYDDLIKTGLNKIREEIKKKYHEKKTSQEQELIEIFINLNIFEKIEFLTKNQKDLLIKLNELRNLKKSLSKYFIYKNIYFNYLEELIDNLEDNNFGNYNYVQIIEIKSFLKIILRLFLEYESIDREKVLKIFFKKDPFLEEFKNIFKYLINIIESIKTKKFEVAQEYYLIILMYSKIIVFLKDNKYQKEISLEQIHNILNNKIINQTTIEAIIQDTFTNIVFDINKKKTDVNLFFKNEIKKKVGKIVDNYDLFTKSLHSDELKITQLLK